MSFVTPVPSDSDADSFDELFLDCREVSAVLAGLTPAAQIIDLTIARALPFARVPLDRLPLSFGVMPAEITDGLLVQVAGSFED